MAGKQKSRRGRARGVGEEGARSIVLQTFEKYQVKNDPEVNRVIDDFVENHARDKEETVKQAAKELARETVYSQIKRESAERVVTARERGEEPRVTREPLSEEERELYFAMLRGGRPVKMEPIEIRREAEPETMLAKEEKGNKEKAQPRAEKEPAVAKAEPKKKEPKLAATPEKPAEKKRRAAEERKREELLERISSGFGGKALELGKGPDVEELERQVNEAGKRRENEKRLTGPAKRKGAGEAAEIAGLRVKGADKDVEAAGAGEERSIGAAKGREVAEKRGKKTDAGRVVWNEDQLRILESGTSSQKRELRSQLRDRKTREERRLGKFRAALDKTKDATVKRRLREDIKRIEETIESLDRQLKDKRLKG
ncbi:hypothetical protein GF412_02800 [Candidatus Micrarchaeota archaeon]|nr:hypothetical protein [Candidatus Micrarchaeota archaeon]MBD3417887.1 hypothetical protein [Candidatus Micrarchaeota archaeon]